MGLASSVGILRRSAPLGGATRTELQINQEDLWRHWSSNSEIILTLMVEMLFRCHLSPEQILNQDRDSTEAHTTIREVYEDRILDHRATTTKRAGSQELTSR